MPDFSIRASNLTKTFGKTVAVSGLDLQVPAGSVYGLVGRNGAGKTTALRLLMGLLKADQGAAEILGWNMWDAPRKVRARVAYVSQSQQLQGWMKLSDLCRYTSYFYDEWDISYARKLADSWELDWNRAVGSMSSGEQRKVGLLLAFASRPEVLILDEPVANLDPIARRGIIDEIVSALSLERGSTILFSTHLLSDLARIAEHVGIMDRGRMVMSERLEEFQSTVKRVQVIFPGKSAPNDFVVPGALRSQVCGPVVTAIARLTNETQLNAVRGWPGVRVQIFSLGLEELFIEVLARSQAEVDGVVEPVGAEPAPNENILSIREI